MRFPAVILALIVSLILAFNLAGASPALAVQEPVSAPAADTCTSKMSRLGEYVGSKPALRDLLRKVYRAILARRYDIHLTDLDTMDNGFKAIKSRGDKGIIFLFEHPGLIDPVIYYSQVGKDFSPRPLIAEEIAQNIMPVVAATRGIVVPQVEAGDRERQRERVDKMIEQIVQGIDQGDNFLIAPAGQIKRENDEVLASKSIVERILKLRPNVRIVMLRSSGIYGSVFSTGKTGKRPDLKNAVTESTIGAFLRGGPKRSVDIEVKEAFDFPRTGTRDAMNRYLENFYNGKPNLNFSVPYENGKPVYIARPVQDPARVKSEASQAALPGAINPEVAKAVLEIVKDLAEGADVGTEKTMEDLGVDSLGVAELLTKVEEKLKIKIELETPPRIVADIITLANRAMGNAEVGGKPAEASKPIFVDPRWFAGDHSQDPVRIPDGKNVAEVFLKQARANPDKVIVVDEITGALTYRDLMLGIYALRPAIKKIKGDFVGIMMPAGVGSTLVWLATIFSGKTPVMINYTSGPQNLKFAAEHMRLSGILTSPVFIDRLKKKDISIDSIADKFVMIDDIKAQITKMQKLAAFARSRFKQLWTTPFSWQISDYSVVLFTSGSTNRPKAVPLTHENQLTNIRDAARVFALEPNDRIIGFLPPFHSFGSTGTQVLPLLAGIPTVYAPDPTDYRGIAKLIGAYEPTIIMGTPTFLEGIARKADKGQLVSLRVALAGAEALKQKTVDLLHEANPNLQILEGYGTTEASPIVAVNPLENPKPGTVGKMLKSVEYAIIDPETRKTVEIGSPGMLLIRGKSIFEGYWKATADQNPFREHAGKSDWYETGDIVVEDADHYIKIVGRLSRFRKRGGEMVNLAMIEHVLQPFLPSDASGAPTLIVESVGDNMPLVLFTPLDLSMSAGQAKAWVREKMKDAGLPPTWYVDEVRQGVAIPVLGTGKANPKALQNLLIEEAKAKR